MALPEVKADLSKLRDQQQRSGPWRNEPGDDGANDGGPAGNASGGTGSSGGAGGTGSSSGGSSEYPCENCGALQAFKPGADHLACAYCGHVTDIDDSHAEVVENDLTAALQAMEDESAQGTLDAVKCDSCAAEFTLEPNHTADECPFCGAAVVVDPTGIRQILPDGVLPFKLNRNEAIAAAQKWLSGYWFAPEKVRKWVTVDQHFHGVYLPHWTYDADTASRYQGQRGDEYTVTVGSGENRRTVTKVRWTPVSGRTSRQFDDVLVPASHSLPSKFLHRLQPWDLGEVRPYNNDYLAGFQSEAYQVSLSDGFTEGKQIMTRQIERDVRRQIGGDRQRITKLDTTYSNTTFKHLLLPSWLSAFRWNDKVYRFVVNARTGQVQGERPISAFKVALVVAGVALVVGGALAAAYYSGWFG